MNIHARPFFFFSPYRNMHDFALPHFYPLTALKLIWVISLFQVQINCTIFPLKYFSNCKISVLARAGITKHKLLLNLNQESYDNLHSWKFARPLHTLEPFHKPPARVWIVLLALQVFSRKFASKDAALPRPATELKHHECSSLSSYVNTTRPFVCNILSTAQQK